MCLIFILPLTFRHLVYTLDTVLALFFRLELSTGQQGHEQSLNPVCNDNGEKVFKCHMCNKEFRTKFAMQRHLDFHAGKYITKEPTKFPRFYDSVVL